METIYCMKTRYLLYGDNILYENEIFLYGDNILYENKILSENIVLCEDKIPYMKRIDSPSHP